MEDNSYPDEVARRWKAERDMAYGYEAKFRKLLAQMLKALEPGYSPDTPWNAEWRKRLQAALNSHKG